ncbi:unnamed protein product [Cladocopium goreaui]|uniref:Ubiquitin-like domain-containing protein n=1 Tax=Cladocopium goreaui TaxID=2562237 RepID=A0A9P1C2X7_9DINO|nr:unnamed protein product [Cladocopium goreaui]
MPAAAPAPEAREAPAVPDSEEAEAVELEGELPGALAADQASMQSVLVRQGRNRYRVRVPQGLKEATFGNLADFLAAQMLPPGIPPSELRLISKGKTASRDDRLGDDGMKEMSVMLLFREGFHVAAEGARWMSEKEEELAKVEAKLASLSKRVEANFSDAETSLQLAEVSDFIETLLQSVDSVRVNSMKLPLMQEQGNPSAQAGPRHRYRDDSL